MSAEHEMRAVLTHAADKLAAVQGESCHGYQQRDDVTIAMSYAEAVLRLLATYLLVGAERDPTPSHRHVGRPPDAPRDGTGRYVSAGAEA